MGFTIKIEIFTHHIRFNVIGMFETMKEDVEFIIRAANLSSSHFPRTHSSSSADSKDHRLVSQRYFRSIDKESVKKLYDIYRIDFEMFDYSIDEYL